MSKLPPCDHDECGLTKCRKGLDKADDATGCSMQRIVRCCFTCKSWHRRKNYACQHNGPWGGGTDGVEGCKWRHNGKISPANEKDQV